MSPSKSERRMSTNQRNEVLMFGKNIEAVSVPEVKRYIYQQKQKLREMQKEIDRLKILLRKFSPVSGYEPDPKREEWQGVGDCWMCPHFTCTFRGEVAFLQVWRCGLNFDPSFCRFSEYRSILFRKF
jgi:hypothetical protein